MLTPLNQRRKAWTLQLQPGQMPEDCFEVAQSFSFVLPAARRAQALVLSASDKVKLESGQSKGVVCDGVVSFKGISAHPEKQIWKSFRALI